MIRRSDQLKSCRKRCQDNFVSWQLSDRSNSNSNIDWFVLPINQLISPEPQTLVKSDQQTSYRYKPDNHFISWSHSDNSHRNPDINQFQFSGRWQDLETSPYDNVIHFAGEKHLANVKQLTFGGMNAEGYFSFDNSKLTLQATGYGTDCDQIYELDLNIDPRLQTLRRISTGLGGTTCSYFFKEADNNHRLYAGNWWNVQIDVSDKENTVTSSEFRIKQTSPRRARRRSVRIRRQKSWSSCAIRVIHGTFSMIMIFSRWEWGAFTDR